MPNDSERLREAIRTQVAVVRALADELKRSDHPAMNDLEGQANAESARLVAAMQDLSSACSQGPDSSPPGRGERSHADGRRARVLVVEDDAATRVAVRRWLAGAYDVIAAADGVEGLELAAKMSPDAIIADLGLPRLDGMSMVRRIREILAPAVVPVIFLTAEAAPERVTESLSAVGASYLLKPVDFDLLDRELRTALRLGARLSSWPPGPP